MSRFGRGPPPDTTGMTSIKVDNLSQNTTADDVETVFEKYGKLGDVYLPKGRYFAIIRFYDKHDAEDAMEAQQGRDMDGRDMRISEVGGYRRPPDTLLRRTVGGLDRNRDADRDRDGDRDGRRSRSRGGARERSR